MPQASPKAGRDGARAKLEQFWLSVSTEGSLAPAQRKLVDAWLRRLGSRRCPGRNGSSAWADALSQFVSPYAFNPLNVNPLRDHLAAAVDFERLRASDDLKLFVAATNVQDRARRDLPPRRPDRRSRHGLGLPADPVPGRRRSAASVYWDGGYAGNPPLWPLFYETQVPRRRHRADQSDRARPRSRGRRRTFRTG